MLKIGRSHTGLVLSLLITVYSLLATWGFSIEGFTRNHNPLNWLFYFVFGIWVATYHDIYKNKLNKYWIYILLLVSLFIVILEPTELTEEILLTQTRPSVIFYSVMVILLFIILPFKNNRFEKGLIELSRYSYQIYLSHYLFIYIYRLVFPDLHAILAIIFVILLSYGLAKLIDRS